MMELLQFARQQGLEVTHDYLIDNPQRRCPDIGKARRELGFEPAVALDDGLRRTLRWYARSEAAS